MGVPSRPPSFRRSVCAVADDDGKRKAFRSTRGTAFGGIQQTFDDVWWAWGTTKFMPGAMIPRNMTIVREGEDLVVIHPVLLPDAMQKEVEALGEVKHIVRLGDFHGMDDKLYVERYAPTVWAPPGATPRDGVKVDHELKGGDELPLKDATLIDFTESLAPETVLHAPRHGGIIFTCDSVQNHGTKAPGTTFLGGLMMKVMGMKGPACIGRGWVKFCQPKEGPGFGPKFRELLELEFRHMMPAHGLPLKEVARDELRKSVSELYG